MRRFILGMAALALCSGALAQTTTDTTTTPAADVSVRLGDDLGDKPPSENVTGGNVNARAPGRIIDRARARHGALATARLAAQRGGDTSALLADDPGSGPSGGLLDDLLGSGLLGALGGSGLDLGSILGGLGGSTAPTTGTPGTTGGTSSGLPPEVLAMLQAAGINPSDLNLSNAKQSNATQQSTTPDDDGDTPDFRVRWSNAMLTAFFTAIVAGISSSQFVDTIADVFAPIFNPAPPANNGNGNQNGGDNGDGGDSGDGDSII